MRKTKTWFTLEDDTCEITYCECGERIDLFIDGSHIYRCPECNRGYFTAFVVKTLDPDEKHMKLYEPDVWDKKLKEAMKETIEFLSKSE